MTDPGLTNRLRQHSRRSGLNVGVSMALAIALCIAGFATIYARLDPLLSDFIGRESRLPAIADGNSAGDGGGDKPNTTARRPTPTPESVTAVAPTPAPTVAPDPTEPAGDFTPDMQANSETAVNLRSSPGVTDVNLLQTLPLAAPLQDLGEIQNVEGEDWTQVRTEDGVEGWILSRATEPYQSLP